MKASIILSTILFSMAFSLGINAMQEQRHIRYQSDQSGQVCQSDQKSKPEQLDPANHHHHNSHDASCSESSSDEGNQNTSNYNGKSIVHLHKIGNIIGSYHDQLLSTEHFHARKVIGIKIWSPKSNSYKTVSRDQAKAMSKIVKNKQDSCCVIKHEQKQYIDMNQWADQL